MSSPKNKTKRRVRIHSPANERIILSNDSDKVEYRKSGPLAVLDKLPQCDGRKFPCVSYGITFENITDLTQYLQLKNKNRGVKRADVIEQVCRTGKYRQYIPQENRLYDLDTGKIYDVASYRPPTKRAQKGGRKTRRR